MIQQNQDTVIVGGIDFLSEVYASFFICGKIA